MQNINILELNCSCQLTMNMIQEVAADGAEAILLAQVFRKIHLDLSQLLMTQELKKIVGSGLGDRGIGIKFRTVNLFHIKDECWCRPPSW